MGLKTMVVIQRATGRQVTINARDFDDERYGLVGEPAPAPPPAPEVPPEETPQTTDFTIEEPAEEPEPERAPRRRRGR